MIATLPHQMIQEQLECFERQPSARRMSDASSSSLALESRLSVLLHIHQMIEGLERNWGSRVRSGEIPYDIKEAERIQSLFKRWLRTASRMLSSLRRLEAHGQRLAHTEQLRDAVGFCFQARINIREVNKAFDRVNRGEALIRLTEGSHGVRRRRAG